MQLSCTNIALFLYTLEIDMARVNAAPSTARTSRQSSATSTSTTSDQENRDPSTTRRDKGKGRASDMPSQGSLPTPTSVDEHGSARAQKRRRTQGPETTGSPNDEEDDEEGKFTRWFDPNQDAEERRILKRKSRALERKFNGKWRALRIFYLHG
jgi:hypothetical protein